VCQSADHPGTYSSSSVSSEFFLDLFGPESCLLKVPVLVVGMQNGQVYFTNFISGSVLSSEVGPNDTSILSPLCDLGQPVVGLHWVYFPPRTVSTDPLVTSWDMETENVQEKVMEAPNVLISVGRRGKVRVIYFDLAAMQQRRQQSEVEYQVPGPVLSSALLPGQCLLFTTVQGLYKVCLQSSCATCTEEKLPSLMGHSGSVVIPHISFNFPEKLQNTCNPSYILKTEPLADHSRSPNSESRSSAQCLYVALDGSVASLDLGEHADGADSSAGGHSSIKRLSADHVGKEIKHCLDSIQLLSDRIAQTRRKIEFLNGVLMELKASVELLSAVADVCGNQTCEVFRSCRPVKCSFTTIQEDAGLKVKSLSVRVGVAYSRPTARQDLPHRLPPGWSILVNASSLRLTGSSFSKSLALSGMTAGESVDLTVAVDMEDLHLPVLVQCFLHYSPAQLCRSSFKNVTSAEDFTECRGCMLHLSSDVLSVLDFAKQCTPASQGSLDKESLSLYERKRARQVFAGDDSLEKHSLRGSSYSTSLPISEATALRAILSRSGCVDKEESLRMDKAVGIRFLQVLQKSCSAYEGGGLGKEAKVTCSMLNGWQVTLEVESNRRELASADHPDENHGTFHLIVQSRSKEGVVEVVEAVHALLNCHASSPASEPREPRTDSLPLQPLSKPEDLRETLENLRGISRRVGAMREELSSAHSQVRDHALPLGSYEQLVKAVKEKMFAGFSELRKSTHM